MKSRVMPTIVTLLDNGHIGHKRYFANKAYCDQRTAARVLCHLWMEGIVCIQGWMREQGAPLPIYARRRKGERDAPKPSPVQAAERKRQMMADPAYRQKANARERMYRMEKRLRSGNVRIGIWGV